MTKPIEIREKTFLKRWICTLQDANKSPMQEWIYYTLGVQITELIAYALVNDMAVMQNLPQAVVGSFGERQVPDMAIKLGGKNIAVWEFKAPEPSSDSAHSSREGDDSGLDRPRTLQDASESVQPIRHVVKNLKQFCKQALVVFEADKSLESFSMICSAGLIVLIIRFHHSNFCSLSAVDSTAAGKPSESPKPELDAPGLESGDPQVGVTNTPQPAKGLSTLPLAKTPDKPVSNATQVREAVDDFKTNILAPEVLFVGNLITADGNPNPAVIYAFLQLVLFPESKMPHVYVQPNTFVSRWIQQCNGKSSDTTEQLISIAREEIDRHIRNETAALEDVYNMIAMDNSYQDAQDKAEDRHVEKDDTFKPRSTQSIQSPPISLTREQHEVLANELAWLKEDALARKLQSTSPTGQDNREASSSSPTVKFSRFGRPLGQAPHRNDLTAWAHSNDLADKKGK
ncbi:hypothetical protein C8Q77DRAFT_1070900 [Trametes polyzona]|nr:hypothetical protein C8Q77DRAFT_1070900 [Trametes polyzona]